MAVEFRPEIRGCWVGAGLGAGCWVHHPPLAWLGLTGEGSASFCTFASASALAQHRHWSGSDIDNDNKIGTGTSTGIGVGIRIDLAIAVFRQAPSVWHCCYWRNLVEASPGCSCWSARVRIAQKVVEVRTFKLFGGSVFSTRK